MEELVDNQIRVGRPMKGWTPLVGSWIDLIHIGGKGSIGDGPPVGDVRR